MKLNCDLNLKEERVTSQAHVGLGNLTKIDRYGWTMKDSPGVFLEIDKDEIRIDDSYQRNVNEDKLMAMARAWSWVACGVIVVADRDSVFYAIDGQHRVLASRRRADLRMLPCIVFETKSAVTEAKGFLEVNTQRKPLTGVDRFRALLVSGDQAAAMIQRLCDQVGREVNNNSSGNSVRCVNTVMRLAATDPEALERMWPLLHQLMDGQPLNERLVGGLLYIEKRMPNGESLTTRKWRERVLRVGPESLLEGANKAAAFYAKGGARVWAIGAINALNYNHRIRLKIQGHGEED